MVTKVRVTMTVIIDESEYPMPADERVNEEVKDVIKEMFHDYDGMDIKSIKTTMEKIYD